MKQMIVTMSGGEKFQVGIPDLRFLSDLNRNIVSARQRNELVQLPFIGTSSLDIYINPNYIVSYTITKEDVGVTGPFAVSSEGSNSPTIVDNSHLLATTVVPSIEEVRRLQLEKQPDMPKYEAAQKAMDEQNDKSLAGKAQTKKNK